MRWFKRLWNRISASRADQVVQARHDAERRRAPRVTDGAWISLVDPDASGRAAVWAPSLEGGACVSSAEFSSATMLDVSATGVRFRSSTSLPMHRRVWCRVQFATGKLDLGVRLVWARTTSDGYEYGGRYVTSLPGTEHLLGSYAQVVQSRAAR